MTEGVPIGTGWRRLRRWHWVAIASGVAVAVVVAAVLIARRGDKPSQGEKACRAVVTALKGTANGSVTKDSALAVVRAQAPVARAAADRDPAYRSVADAIGQIQADLEAGRPFPSVVVLYNACG